MAYQMAATAVTLKVIHRLHAFSNAICRTFVQHFTRFQLTVCSHERSRITLTGHRNRIILVSSVTNHFKSVSFLLLKADHRDTSLSNEKKAKALNAMVKIIFD